MINDMTIPTFDEFLDTPGEELTAWHIMFIAALAYIMESTDAVGMEEEDVYNMLRLQVAKTAPAILGKDVIWKGV